MTVRTRDDTTRSEARQSRATLLFGALPIATGGGKTEKQRVRRLEAALVFRMELHPDEERVLRQFDRFHEHVVRRHSGEYEASLFVLGAVLVVEFLAVA